jgi:hypothetical protein
MVPITGNPASNAVVEPGARSLRRTSSGGKMPVEGKLDEAGQAGMQMSIHVEGGAAIVGPTRGRSSPHPLADST